MGLSPSERLVDRPAGAVLFRTPDRAIDTAAFLADVTRVAASLPARGHVANLCQDRYWFAVGLAAAVLRGQISLLSGDPSAGVLARLLAEFPDAYALTSEAATSPQPLPTHPVGPGPDPGPDPGPESRSRPRSRPGRRDAVR